MYYIITEPSKHFDFVGIIGDKWNKIDEKNIKSIKARISGIEKAIIYMNNHFIKTKGLHIEKCNDFTKKVLMQRFGNRFYDCYKGKLNVVKKQEDKKTYIVYDKFSELYKIGRSNDIDKRINALKTANPYIEFVMKFDRDIEKELHSDYSHKRLDREWFALTLEDLQVIERYYRFERKPKIKNTIDKVFKKPQKKKNKYWDEKSIKKIKEEFEDRYNKRHFK